MRMKLRENSQNATTHLPTIYRNAVPLELRISWTSASKNLKGVPLQKSCWNFLFVLSQSRSLISQSNTNMENSLKCVILGHNLIFWKWMMISILETLTIIYNSVSLIQFGHCDRPFTCILQMYVLGVEFQLFYSKYTAGINIISLQ